MEAERLCSVRVVRTRNLQTGSTDNLILWERQLYVEYTEIGKELSRLMKLMAVPCPMPPHADLRKPLRAHRKSSLVAGSCYHFRKLVMELDAELDRLSRSNCTWKLHLYHGPVVRIVVIRRNELQPGS